MAKKQLTRKLYIVGDISEESYLVFSKRLSALERQAPTPIDIELVSWGGEVYSALAWAARMQASPCDLRVKAFGIVASASVLILAAGDQREMSASAWLMVHEDSLSGEIQANTSQLEKIARHSRRMEKQWATLLAGLSTTSADEWERLHKKDVYIPAEKCKALGIVDRTF